MFVHTVLITLYVLLWYFIFMLGFSVCIQLHFSLSLSESISLSLPFCLHYIPALSVFLSFSHCLYSGHNFSLHLSVCIQSHFSLLMCIHFSLTVPLTADVFIPFSFSPCYCLSAPVSFLLHLFALLSISICLSGQFGFSEGCTLTQWNGVSLFLRWWRHLAVRITTPDIDKLETQDFRGHRELVGRRGEASKQCMHQL